MNMQECFEWKRRGIAVPPMQNSMFPHQYPNALQTPFTVLIHVLGNCVFFRFGRHIMSLKKEKLRSNFTTLSCARLDSRVASPA